MIKIRLLILITSCLSVFNSLMAQENYILDTIYFPGQKVSKVTITNGNDFWILCDDSIKSIYRIDKHGNIEDKTIEFSIPRQYIITDIVSMGDNELLLGTSTSFAYYYKDGVFTHIDESYGISPMDSSVSFLTYSEENISYIGNRFIGIATNGAIYTGDSLENLYVTYDYPNAKLLCHTKAFVYTFFEEINRRIAYSFGGNTYYLLYFYDLTSRIVTCADVCYSSGRLWSYQVGTDSGFYTNRNNLENKLYLPNQSIHSIIDLKNCNYIVGADSGIYLGYMLDVPERIDLGIGYFKANEIVELYNNLIVASDTGLIFIKNTDCSLYDVDFTQNNKYLSIVSDDSLTFEIEHYCFSDSYTWDFGDGNSSSIHFPKYKYDSSATYMLKLIASNDFCFDTAESFVVVYNDSADFYTSFNQYLKFPFDNNTTLSGEINLIDADGDNDLDVFIPYTGLFENYDSSNFYLRNTGFNADLKCSVWGDLNNDGLNDLIGSNFVYKNLGDFNFQQIMFNANPLLNPDVLNHSAGYLMSSLYDVDTNGYLDIILAFPDVVSVMFNKGNFSFEKDDSLFKDGINYEVLKWLDIDKDMDFDLLFCGSYKHNQVYKKENELFSNDECPILTDITTSDGPIGDLNNDLLYDYYTFNEDTVFLLENSKDSFNTINNTWLTCETGGFLNSPTLFDDAIFTDLDNNGYLDCLRLSGGENNRAFMNLGQFLFINDTTNPIKNAIGSHYRSVASADLTGDGYPEILIGQGDPDDTYFKYRNLFYLNEGKSNHNYVKILCIGSKSNSNAIGTSAFLKSKINGKDQWQVRQIISKSTYYTQNGYEILFGVDSSIVIDSLVIQWPSGYISIFENLTTNKYYKIIEPLLRVEGNTVICEYEKNKLSLAFERNTKYQWFLDGSELAEDTSNMIIPVQSGTYYCHVINPDYSFISDSIKIMINPATNTLIYYPDSLDYFCDGDSILISSDLENNLSYNWLINNSLSEIDTAHFLFIKNPAEIRQIVINEFGCKDTSNSLVPSVIIKPNTGIKTTYRYCTDDSVFIKVDSNYLNYYWENGDSMYYTSFNSPGNKFLNIIDTNNCSWDYFFEVIEQEIPTVNLGNDTILGLSDSYSPLTTCKNELTYLWYDSIDYCLRYFDSQNLLEGNNNIYVTVKDYLNCTNSDTLNIILKTGNEPINIYPNPANEYINLFFKERLETEEIQVFLYNNNGQCVLDRKIGIKYNHHAYLSLKNLDSGVYYLKIMNKDNSSTLKLIINK